MFGRHRGAIDTQSAVSNGERETDGGVVQVVDVAPIQVLCRLDIFFFSLAGVVCAGCVHGLLPPLWMAVFEVGVEKQVVVAGDDDFVLVRLLEQPC